MNLHARIEAPTRSPITPDDDQNRVLDALAELAADLDITIDAGPLDEPTTATCDQDSHHRAEIALHHRADPSERDPVRRAVSYLCLECGKGVLRWCDPGDHVAVDVLLLADVQAEVAGAAA